MRIVPLLHGYIEIGLQTYKKVPLEAPFAMAHSERCGLLEVFFDKDLQHGFHPRDLRESSRKFIRDCGLRVTVHAPMLDFGKQGWQTLLADTVEFGHEVGGAALTLHPPCTDDRSLWQEVAGILRPWIQWGRVMLENTPELGGPDRLNTAVSLLSATLQKQVGVTFDCGHANLWPGGACEFLRRVAAPVWHLHLHDNKGARDEHLPPGQGNIDFPGLLRQLSERDFRGSGIVEYWRPESLSSDITRLQRWGVALFGG